MPKKTFKTHNRASKIYIGAADATLLGTIWVALSERGLAAVEIQGDQENFIRSLEGLFSKQGTSYLPEIVYDASRTAEATAQLTEYLAGQRRSFDLPIDWSVMPAFQQRALQMVYAIPYGQVITYGEIARQIGSPRAFRAVGRANATNPMPLVIPCHRVLGADGGLHGYGAPGGLQTKAWLLELEGRGV